MKAIYTICMVLIGMGIGSACTCVEIKSPFNQKVKKAYAKNDLIFTGKVVSKEQINTESTAVFGKQVRFTFEIIKVIKGAKKVTQIQVITNEDSASCGYAFVVGKSYLVYSKSTDYYAEVTGSKYDYSTGLCARNSRLSSVRRRELRILNRLDRQ